MRSGNWWLSACLGVCALVAGACSGTTNSSPTSSGGSGAVKIGISAGFSGDTAFFGQGSQRGIQLAIQELQAANPRITYQLVTADDQCSPDGGGLAFGRLIDVEQVDAILGSDCSGATLAGMPLAQRAGVPTLTYSATNPKVSLQAGIGGDPYEWRMELDDSLIAKFGAKYVAQQGLIHKAVVLAEDNDFGRAAAAVWGQLLKQNGVPVADTEYFKVGTSDVRPQLTKMAASQPDGIVMLSEASECALAARQMAELGLKWLITGRGGCTDALGLKAVGDPSMVEGATDFSNWGITTDQPFFAAFAAKYPGVTVDENAALGYYAMYTIAQAVQQGGLGRAGIEKGLGLVDWKSPMGEIKFDDHDQAHPDLFVVTIVKGKVAVQTVTTQR